MYRRVEKGREGDNGHRRGIAKKREGYRETVTWNKIEQAKYNRKYKDWAVIGKPGYLREENLGRYIWVFAKVRCGNLGEENRCWGDSEERKCRLCRKEEGSIKHLVWDCEKTREWRTDLPRLVQVRWERACYEKGYIQVGKFFKKVIKEIEKIEKKEKKEKGGQKARE